LQTSWKPDSQDQARSRENWTINEKTSQPGLPTYTNLAIETLVLVWRFTAWRTTGERVRRFAL